MTKRTIQHKPSKVQAFIWLVALLMIPFVYLFENGLYSFFYKKTQCREPRRREWRSFAVPIPPGYSVHGLDVSHYSCNIDWDAVKTMNENGVNVDFVFMRATKGLDLVDYQLKDNWEGAKSANILRGAYHFFRYDLDPARQAEFFCKHVKIEVGDLPPVLDIENDKNTNDAKLPKLEVQKNMARWLMIVESKTGVKPLIYCNLEYYKRYIKEKFPDYKIWVANYDNNKNVKLPDGRAWHFWQTSENARCSGISEKMDFNVFNGDLGALKGLCKQE